MLGHVAMDLELEDLADLATEDRRRAQVRPAVRAGDRLVDDDLCRVVDLIEVPTLVARLRALTPRLGPTLGSPRSWRRGEPLSRHRHRRVASGAAHALFEIGESGFECCDARVTLNELLAQPGALLFTLSDPLVLRHARQFSAPAKTSRAPRECVRAGRANACELAREGVSARGGRDVNSHGAASLTNRALRRSDPREEPIAVVQHAGICAGGHPKGRSRPQSRREDLLAQMPNAPDVARPRR